MAEHIFKTGVESYDEEHYGVLTCSCGDYRARFEGSPDVFNVQLRALITEHKVDVLAQAAGLTFKLEEEFLENSFRIV